MRPSKGEVWLVDFDPTEGAEIGKRRPAVVVNEDDVGALPLAIVVPVTAWQDHFEAQTWKVRLPADPATGITKESAADSFQVQSASTNRFIRRLGTLQPAVVESICLSVAVCIGVTAADAD